jgi:carbon-monoxide dehydrogenase medium subunit
MKLWSHYHVAHSVDEALDLLARYEGNARLIAGGTDLLLDIQQGNHPPLEALVDITKIRELTAVTVEGDELTLGAGVTHTAIVDNLTIQSRATALTESCGVVGGPQVRNVATIGGNVAHALPAADGTLSLVALRATAEVASPKGREWCEIGELFLGAGQSRVHSSREVLTRFRFKLAGPGEASAFKRIMRPQGVALPVLGCAVWVKLDTARECFTDVSICVGPVSPTPTRAAEVESSLISQPANDATIERAAQLAREILHPRTSKYRATAEYRVEMIELLVRESLTVAVERAKN